MKFSEFFTSKDNIQLDKKTLVILRWIALVGQYITISIVYFIFQFELPFFYCSLIIFVGVLTNFYLQFKFKKNQLNNFPFNELIEKNHVYLAQPPLYKITKGSKSYYIKNDKELENFLIGSSDKTKSSIKKNTKEFEKFIEKEKSKLNIQRFKGLGEMNPEELWQTTLNPAERTLLQVKYSNNTKAKSKKDQDLIQILMGDEVAPRKDFIINRALEVSNLDI